LEQETHQVSQIDPDFFLGAYTHTQVSNQHTTPPLTLCEQKEQQLVELTLH